MNPLLIILIALLVISGLGLIIFILLHSGKGTGISDMIASSVYSSQTGTSIVEEPRPHHHHLRGRLLAVAYRAYDRVSVRHYRHPIKFFEIGSWQVRKVRVY